MFSIIWGFFLLLLLVSTLEMFVVIRSSHGMDCLVQPVDDVYRNAILRPQCTRPWSEFFLFETFGDKKKS
jgi:hypothetical protein